MGYAKTAEFVQLLLTLMVNKAVELKLQGINHV